MEYYKYITDNSISDYESLVKDLTQKYNIKFKEDGDLFLMYQDIDEKQYNDDEYNDGERGEEKEKRKRGWKADLGGLRELFNSLVDKDRTKPVKFF